MIKITQSIPSIPLKSNSEKRKIYRVIGTVDMDGNGTKHSIGNIDPFIFLDEAIMTKEGTTFFKHPHSGLSAISFILSGEIQAWDNFSGYSKVNNKAGGIYYINSGRGVVHSESGVNLKDNLHWLQLWINPGIYGHPLPKASTQLVLPSAIPKYTEKGMCISILIGKIKNLTSPVNSDWPILYMHCSISPKTEKELDLNHTDWNGFVYILNGQGHFGENKISGKYQDSLEFNTKKSTQLKIFNNSSLELNFVLAIGKPHNKDFFKLLGHGGAIVADTVDNARESMLRFEQDPENYGH